MAQTSGATDKPNVYVGRRSYDFFLVELGFYVKS